MNPSSLDTHTPGQAGTARTGLGVVLALLASACAALPLLDRFGPLQIAAWLGVSISCACLARSARPGTKAAASAASPGQSSIDAGGHRLRDLSQLLLSVLPVWLQHVGSVKGQTEQAINQLASSFASISTQFESAGFKGANGPSVDAPTTSISLLTLCERELQPVIASMTKLLDGKTAMAASVIELAAATKELQDMAGAVAQIAAQTNLLALNAAIEAARVGSAGRGFAVIAKEIRSLSQISATTGKQITERMQQVARIMKTAVEAAARAAVDDKAAIELSGSVVMDVLSHVRELSAGAEKMRGQGNIIRDDIEHLLVSLQFQDRVSQIIGVIDSDILRLQTSIQDGQELPGREQWLAELKALYTMDEQRQNHQRHGAHQSAAAAAPAAAEVEYF